MAAGVSPEHWVESAVEIMPTMEPHADRDLVVGNWSMTGRLVGVSEYGVVLQVVSYSEGERSEDVSFYPWSQVSSMRQVDESRIVS